MATIQTSELVDGQWVNRNVDLEAVLHQHQLPTPGLANDQELAPQVGLMTQTVIQDPVSRWIFPIRLQRDGKQDIVFIGVSEMPLQPIKIEHMPLPRPLPYSVFQCQFPE